MDVSPALAVADVKATMGFEGILKPANLQGIASSSTYGKARLRPEAPKDHFGVALQVWRGSEAQASERFEMFSKTYKSPRLTRELGKKTLRDKRGRILNLTWLSDRRHEVIALACDDRLCKADTLLKLAKRVEVRLAALP